MDVHFHMFGSEPTQKYLFLCLWCDLTLSEYALFIKTTKLHMCFEIFGVRTMMLSNREKKSWFFWSCTHHATMAARQLLVVKRRTHIAQNERIKVKIPSDLQSARRWVDFLTGSCLLGSWKVSSLNLSRKAFLLRHTYAIPTLLFLFSNNFRWNRASGFRFWQRRKSVRSFHLQIFKMPVRAPPKPSPSNNVCVRD